MMPSRSDHHVCDEEATWAVAKDNLVTTSSPVVGRVGRDSAAEVAQLGQRKRR
jgi:hypothetical protein